MNLRSSIKTTVIYSILMRGTFFAGIGILALLFFGIFIPVDPLKIYGPFIILISLLFITLGLYPYQQLKQLEVKPHEIFLNEDHLLFSWKRKPTILVPFSEIDKIINVQLESRYGIGLLLKKPVNANLVDPHFDVKKFMASSQKIYQCDLFFPYFTTYSFKKCKQAIENAKEK